MTNPKKQRHPHKYTEEKRQAIIADYVLTGNLSAVARSHNIAVSTVRYLVYSDPNLVSCCNDKKEEVLQSVLDYLETEGEQHKTILGKLLKRMNDDEAINKLSPQQAATVYGILVDKQLAATGKRGNNISIQIGVANATPEDIEKWSM